VRQYLLRGVGFAKAALLHDAATVVRHDTAGKEQARGAWCGFGLWPST
jgi:hypothetical protein